LQGFFPSIKPPSTCSSSRRGIVRMQTPTAPPDVKTSSGVVSSSSQRSPVWNREAWIRGFETARTEEAYQLNGTYPADMVSTCRWPFPPSTAYYYPWD